MAIWSIVCTDIWYILCLFGISFSRFGMLYQEKSGNPAHDHSGWIHLALLTYIMEVAIAGGDSTVEQGCQIFLDTMYQNGGKYTKLLLTYQTAITYAKWP
jgi:hypothetical protein